MYAMCMNKCTPPFMHYLFFKCTRIFRVWVMRPPIQPIGFGVPRRGEVIRLSILLTLNY